MKNLNLPDIDQYRTELGGYGWAGDGTCGSFMIPSCTDRKSLKVIASSGFGWEHVSVSREKRIPNWLEMCQIKDLFFDDEEAVMQLHPPKSQYVNYHPNCLHLWKPTDQEIPLPDTMMIGPK